MMLENSNVFCMYPWIHLHVNPTGVASPCCVSKSTETYTGVGDAKTQSLMELVNSDQMKKLRLDMLGGKRNPECTKCYAHEDVGVKSARQYANQEWESAFDEVLDYTNLDDGSVNTFHMKYFDIRFSNICNFKCRTCGAEFSSQWEHEDLKSKVIYAREIPKNNNKQFLSDVIEQIDFMEKAYFAGGEPLITEEHYIILEEMIRRKKTNIKLRYNTNLSNFKFKNKDILGLWKHFDNPIELYASIDHYGERAEYIRNGTDWGVVESNFLLAKQQPNILLQINTVLSLFNYLTIFEFYEYLISKRMYTRKDNVYQLYCASTPKHIACHALPKRFKDLGAESIMKAINLMDVYGFSNGKIEQLAAAPDWANSLDTYEEQKEFMQSEIRRLDNLRGEKFDKVFPELRGLLEDPRKKHWPV